MDNQYNQNRKCLLHKKQQSTLRISNSEAKALTTIEARRNATNQIKGVAAQEHGFLSRLIPEHVSSPFVLPAIEVRLGQEVKITIHNLIFLHYRSGHIGHARCRSRDDLVGAEPAANARTPSVEPGVCRRELCRILLDPHELLGRPADARKNHHENSIKTNQIRDS